MSKRGRNNVINIGLKELNEGVPNGETVLDTKNTPLPIESLRILFTGDSNDKFRVLSKRINTQNVKLVLKHRETGEQVKIVAPIEFLEFHKIPYKNPVIPTNKQIEGVLQNKVKAWECEIIVTDLSKDHNLVVLLDKDSNKKIACKVPISEIQNTTFYIEKSKTPAQAMDYNFDKVHIWRENEWQREAMTKINLLRLTH